ncbi:unnamed protein product [Rhizoctonia solani]|uniref:Mediator of RNA polymerase II transcription subunit 25 n=1 Tax=Rhizoctonia solani TaxID=456999 RepID=A0A8H2XS92_9AGAM|nr:unnamed protein product [Rhizoctonia solani]
MTSGDVKLCIVCDSAISASVFATLAMQVIQPMVLRLQDKHAGSKLTVGIVTYTTPTTRPAIVARRAFTQAGALFPLFRSDPHSIGIGTSGSGGPIGMAILEGLVAAMEMCDDVLEAPARRQRIRHPSIPVQTSPTPIFHVLLIGGSRPDLARRPLCNRSASLDDTTWDTLPDELKKRNINLSLCLSTPIKELVAVHTKLWPTPDSVWFPRTKGYTILLSGTHMANAKRQLEAPSTGPTQVTASKRAKNDSPKPAALPHPPSIPQSQPPQFQFDTSFIASYRQLRMLLGNPNAPPEQRAKLQQTGFRIDQNGAFIGGAGVIFDGKGQPGPGAMVPPKIHHEQRMRQIQLMRANAAGDHPTAQQTLRAMQQQQQAMAAMAAAAVASGSIQALNPNQPPVSQPESNPSPSHHRSPSHTQAQPPANLEAQPHSIPQPGHAFQPGGAGAPAPSQQAPFYPATASPAHQPGVPPGQHGVPATPQQQTGTPQHPITISTPQHASTPQHPGVSPPQGTPQFAHSTPQAVHSTPKIAHSTPQMAHSTPQMTHLTPQMAHSTPQMAHSTPQMAHSIPTQVSDQTMSGGGGQRQSPSSTQGLPGSHVPGMPGSGQHPGGAPAQIPGGLPGAGGTNLSQGSGSTGIPNTTSNVWRVFTSRRSVQVLQIEACNETHRWPARLDKTNGFQQLPLNAAIQLYNSPVPFGQMTINQDHASTDVQKWQVFQKIVTAGWCIFYEFPADPTMNPTQGPRGALFFSAPQAPGRVLFKAFVNQPCPPLFTRGGQPAGPALTRPPSNPAAGGNNQAPVTAPATAPNPPVPVAPSISPAPGIGTITGIPGAAGAQPAMPGAGIIPGAGVPGMPGRQNPTPNPPHPNLNGNTNPSPIPPTIPGTGVPGAGLGPGMMQGLNPAIAAMNAAGSMNGMNPGAAGIPGAAGLNPGMVPGLNPAAAAAAAAANSNPQNNINRMLSQMALARLGYTPAQLAAASPQQKQVMLLQIQQVVPHLRQQLQQNLTGNMGVGIQPRSGPQPGIPNGQPGLEHLQQFIRSQQQQQQQQQQQRHG